MDLSSPLDDADERLITGMRRQPRASITNLARMTGMARGTVQSRLDRLHERGVITGHGPELAAPTIGYSVVAFATLSINQGGHDALIERLATVAEVLEVHVITGSGDLLCRIAARSNDHLHELIQLIVAMPEVSRTDTQLALASPISRTLADLLVTRTSNRSSGVRQT
jgi:DNA-binding Lrp family transcriptional regulator